MYVKSLCNVNTDNISMQDSKKILKHNYPKYIGKWIGSLNSRRLMNILVNDSNKSEMLKCCIYMEYKLNSKQTDHNDK